MGLNYSVIKAELAKRSGIANPKEISDEIAERVIKYTIENAKDAERATGWKLHSETVHFRTHYSREYDAKRAAAKHGVKYSSAADYVRNRKYHLVKNLLNPNGGWVVEAVGTPGFLSVASEAYHSM